MNLISSSKSQKRTQTQATIISKQVALMPHQLVQHLPHGGRHVARRDPRGREAGSGGRGGVLSTSEVRGAKNAVLMMSMFKFNKGLLLV